VYTRYYAAILKEQVSTATNQHVTTEERLEAVFSVVGAAVIAKQRDGKHVSVATVELQQ
jgi:hypothetical protein